MKKINHHVMIIKAVILSIFITAVAGICCEDNWIKYGNSCYLFVGNKETWYEANVICQNHQAELASIQSTEEDFFLKGYLNKFAALGADMKTWLGGTDMEIEGIWKWPNGEKFTYVDWFPGQPGLGQHLDGGDCLVLWNFKSLEYSWGDTFCHSQYTFVCEKGLPTDPGVIG